MNNSDFLFINKLLKDFNHQIDKKIIFKNFCHSMLNKYNQQCNSYLETKQIISMAHKYLIYCDNFKINLPSQSSIEGYLWINYNHKTYLKHLILFLKTYYKYNIQIDYIKKPILTRPKRSHNILKERIIYILENPNDKHLTKKYIFDTLIGYFHWIYIPSNAYLSKNNFKIINNNYYCIISQYKFYLPKIIIEKYLFNI
jgi:hypothetical protein